MRASIFIEGPDGECIVIDTGPEFRLQAVAAKIRKLDAVLLTHSHADHLHGLDDVRPLTGDGSLPVYGNRETIEEMIERFSYVFRETQRGGGKPRLTPVVVTDPIRIGGLIITPIPVKHGGLDILGWQIAGALPAAAYGAEEAFLYLTDASALPETSRALIARPKVLIIDGLRERPHETHFSFTEALETGLDLGARQIWLTHICHNHSHREIEKFCSAFKKAKNIKETTLLPAWDGLELRV
jgi:phosphoribosyl 1,2-cyclic phosphate phosphodiesterase